MGTKAIVALALVALCAVARANDPTTSLPGVKDLSKKFKCALRAEDAMIVFVLCVLTTPFFLQLLITLIRSWMVARLH